MAKTRSHGKPNCGDCHTLTHCEGRGICLAEVLHEDIMKPLTPADVQVGDWVRVGHKDWNADHFGEVKSRIYEGKTGDAVTLTNYMSFPLSWIKEVRR